MRAALAFILLVCVEFRLRFGFRFILGEFLFRVLLWAVFWLIIFCLLLCFGLTVSIIQQTQQEANSHLFTNSCRSRNLLEDHIGS